MDEGADAPDSDGVDAAVEDDASDAADVDTVEGEEVPTDEDPVGDDALADDDPVGGDAPTDDAPVGDDVPEDDADAVDTYEVSTWEVRGPLDRLAVRIHGAITGGWTWLLVGLSVLLLLAQFTVAAMVVASSPSVAVFTLLSFVPALLLAAWVYRVSEEHEPPRTILLTFLLGALFANFAVLINSPLGRIVESIPLVGLALFYLVFVGPIEETVKWLAVRLWAYRRPTFDHVVDGAVYGAAAGLGFATIENTLYIGNHVLAAVNQGQPVFLATVSMAGTRALAGPGHVIYSTFAGYYLGLAKYNPAQRGPIVVKGLLIAAGIHGVYNVLVSQPVFLNPIAFFGFIVAFDGLFSLLLYRKLARYRRTTDRLATGGTADGDG